MSIQIANPGGRAEREELKGRLTGLFKSYADAARTDHASEEDHVKAHDKFGDELKSLWFALLGSYPTGEDLREIIGG